MSGMLAGQPHIQIYIYVIFIFIYLLYIHVSNKAAGGVEVQVAAATAAWQGCTTFRLNQSLVVMLIVKIRWDAPFNEITGEVIAGTVSIPRTALTAGGEGLQPLGKWQGGQEASRGMPNLISYSNKSSMLLRQHKGWLG